MKNVKSETNILWLKINNCAYTTYISLLLLFMLNFISCKSKNIDGKKDSTAVVVNPFKSWSIHLLSQSDFASGYIRFDSFGNPIPSTLKITLNPDSQTGIKIIKKLLDLLPATILSQIGNKSSVDEINEVLKKNDLKVGIFIGANEQLSGVSSTLLSILKAIDFVDLKSLSIPFTENLIEADVKLVAKYSTYKSIVVEVTGHDGLKYAEINRPSVIPYFKIIISWNRILSNNEVEWSLGVWEIKVDKVSGKTSIITRE